MKSQVLLLLGTFVTNVLAGRTSHINAAMAEVSEHINDKAQNEERADVSKLQAEITALRQQRDTFQQQRDTLAKALTSQDKEVAKVLSDIAQEDPAGEGDEPDGKVSSLVDVQDEVTAANNPFLEMTPQKLLAYKKSLCGKMWPKNCASERSATTHATDGFLCDSHGIPDITIYKNKYKFLNAGPNERGFVDHARCVAGKCVKSLRHLAKTRIKTISELGAQLCEWAAPKAVTITVKGKKQKVEVEVIKAAAGHAVEDISLKLNIPIAAVTFEVATSNGATGQKFLDEATATKAIHDALAKVGAVVSALHGKVCGHGFTNGAQAKIDGAKEAYRTLVMGRAATVAEVAKAQSGNSNINAFEGVAHLVHVNTPSAGIIIKLNGASSEACLEADWVGAPL